MTFIQAEINLMILNNSGYRKDLTDEDLNSENLVLWEYVLV